MIWKTVLFLLLCLFYIVIIFQSNYDVNVDSDFSYSQKETKGNLLEYQKINEETQLVLYFSDRVIPVVQSKDNRDYVRMNLLKEEDSMGTAMIDYKAANSENLIIHAHSSDKNNDMFTPFKDREYLILNERFFVEDVNGTHEWQMVSYLYLDIENSEDYFFLETSWRNQIELKRHIQQLMDQSLITFVEELENISNMMTLVTCDVTNNQYRHVVIAIPIE